MKDYGYNVEQFNHDHSYDNGCQVARTPGSDFTDCDTHGAFVRHGVPSILRDI